MNSPQMIEEGDEAVNMSASEYIPQHARPRRPVMGGARRGLQEGHGLALFSCLRAIHRYFVIEKPTTYVLRYAAIQSSRGWACAEGEWCRQKG
jgi:hypothetical protein